MHPMIQSSFICDFSSEYHTWGWFRILMLKLSVAFIKKPFALITQKTERRKCAASASDYHNDTMQLWYCYFTGTGTLTAFHCSLPPPCAIIDSISDNVWCAYFDNNRNVWVWIWIWVTVPVWGFVRFRSLNALNYNSHNSTITVVLVYYLVCSPSSLVLMTWYDHHTISNNFNLTLKHGVSIEFEN